MTRAAWLRTAALTCASLCVLVALGLFAVGRRSAGREIAYTGTPIVPPKPAADATLVDGRGRPAHLLAPGVTATLLFFGYTHCPDACPLALAALAKAYHELSAPQAARTRVVFVTVDPQRDSPAVIARYVAKFDPHFIGLTGPRVTLARVWADYGVAVDPTSHEIGHGDAIYAIDATAHVVTIYPPSVSAADLYSDVAKLTS